MRARLVALQGGASKKNTRRFQFSGAGASLPSPLFDVSNSMYMTLNPELAVSYNTSSSVAGLAALLEGRVDFAATELSHSWSSQPHSTQLIRVPVVAESVVPVYQLNTIDCFVGAASCETEADLVLERGVLADIYMGKVTRWDDERILQRNPTAPLQRLLKGKEISVVYLTTESGMIEIFTRALSSFSGEWESTHGVTKSLKLEVSDESAHTTGVSTKPALLVF